MQTSPMHPHACPRTNNSGDRSCLISERMMLTCATCTDQMYARRVVGSQCQFYSFWTSQSSQQREREREREMHIRGYHRFYMVHVYTQTPQRRACVSYRCARVDCIAFSIDDPFGIESQVRLLPIQLTSCQKMKTWFTCWNSYLAR